MIYEIKENLFDTVLSINLLHVLLETMLKHINLLVY